MNMSEFAGKFVDDTAIIDPIAAIADAVSKGLSVSFCPAPEVEGMKIHLSDGGKLAADNYIGLETLASGEVGWQIAYRIKICMRAMEKARKKEGDGYVSI